MAFFGRLRSESLRHYRCRWSIARGRRAGAIFRSSLFVIAVARAFLYCAVAKADILDDETLKAIRSPVVVRIENAQGAVKGFGVVINPQGDLLTAAHVIEGMPADAVRGRLGPWDETESVPLTLIDKNADKKVDLALLRVKGPLGRVAPENVPELVTGFSPTTDVLRVLTDSIGLEKTLVCLDARISAGKQDVLEVKAAINSGVSGSPLFDRSGNLVGIVVQGIANQQTGYIRPVATIKEWLKGKQVKFTEVPPAPIRIDIFFSRQTLAPEANNRLSDIIVPLTQAINKDVRGKLNPAPQVFDDSKAREKWGDVGEALFKDQSLPAPQKEQKVKNLLKDTEYLAWLRKLNFSRLYLLIIRVELDGNYFTLKPALLVVTQHGQRIDVQYLVDPKANYKTYPPRDLSPNESLPALQDSLAVELIHTIIRKEPSLAKNNQALADCIKFPGLDFAKYDWFYGATDSLAAQLRTTFEEKPDEGRVNFMSANEKTCREAQSRKVDRFAWPDHLAEYVIGVSIGADSVNWQAGHPWDEPDDFLRERVDRGEANPEARDGFGKIAKSLASAINNEWRKLRSGAKRGAK